jgi:hypothetical protein
MPEVSDERLFELTWRGPDVIAALAAVRQDPAVAAKDSGFPLFRWGPVARTLRGMREFAAKQYLPGTDAAVAERSASVARLAAEQRALEGTAIEFARLIFMREDETCIDMYKADSIKAVEKVAAQAALRFERVFEAVTDTGSTARARGD